MSTPPTLHERLADLAQAAPPGGPAPNLWERGRRIHRVRRAGTVVIAAAACLVLVAILAVSWYRAAPEPEPARGPVGLPDRVWSPSPWLPLSERPGQLIALAGAVRATWTGTHDSVVGISATTGAYTFLDLPGAELENGGVELAPDGRHIAYWLTGETTGTPNSDSGPLTGVAVYDTETGDVTRHWIDTAHGLMPDFLAWADGDTLVYSAGQIRGGDDDSLNDQSSSSFGTAMAWSLGGEPRPVAGAERGPDLQGVGHGWIVLRSGPDRRGTSGGLVVDPTDPSRRWAVRYPSPEGAVGALHFLAIDRSGRRIAVVPGSHNPNRVQAGPVGRIREVPDSRGTFNVVDWVDAHTIVTLRRAGGVAGGQSAYYSVTLPTGASHELVRFPAFSFGGSWQFATDLLSAPSVHGERPPSPADPRAVTGGVATTVVVGMAALLVWRRRVRP